MNAADVERLMHDSSIIRNRKKIESAIQNAQAFIAIQNEFGSFDAYIWNWVDGRVQKRIGKAAVSESELSRTIAKDLKKRGFSFLGPTIVYAYLQAVGVVNDHELACFRYGVKDTHRIVHKNNSRDI